MKISCSIIEDLLPLYIDGGCTEDTIQTVEMHLQECPRCKKMYEQMSCSIRGRAPEQSYETAILKEYSKKVRKGKRRRVTLVILLVLLCTVVGSLTALTLHEMKLQREPIVHEQEDGVWNLTAGDLTVNADEADKYTLYTNYTQIQVTVQAEEQVSGTVYLYNSEHDEPILQFQLDESQQSCCFTNLTSRDLYVVEVECDGAAQVIISEGRATDFFSCLLLVLEEIGTLILQ